MNRFVGLSLICLVFVSAQADSGEIKSEFKGSSWSLYMSQNGDEPIQVQSERKEYDKNGMTVHKKSQGIIDRDGIYKPIDAQDFQSLGKSRSFSEWNQKEDEKKFDRDEFLRNQHKVKSHKKHGGLWKVLAYPFVKDDDDNSQDKAFQKKRFHGVHPNFTGPEENDMEKKLSNRSRVSFYKPVEKMFERIFGPKRESEEKWRSQEKRPSFWSKSNQKQRVQQPPFEHESERRSPFGVERNQNPKIENPPFKHDQNPRMQPPIKPRPVKKAERKQPKHWFNDFERRQRAMWEQMRELEESFFSDFYEEEE